MSVTSQKSNMRRLAVLSGRDPIEFFGAQESGHRYYYTDILVPNGHTLGDFICRR